MSEMNEWINWIKEAISKKYIKHYEYKEFKIIQEIGAGGFGKVYYVNWKNSHQYFVLKSLLNINDVAIKELVHEVITKYIYILRNHCDIWLKLFYYNLPRLNFNVKLLSTIISLAFMELLLQIKVINKIFNNKQ